MTAAKRLEDLIKRPWSSEEDERLRGVWATGSHTAIRQAFPWRKFGAIRGRASQLGLKRARPLRAEEGRKVLSPVIEREGVKGKACTTCLQWKPLEKFGRHATCAGGRRNTCPACEGRQARRNDPEKCKANVRAYQARNPEKMKVHRANTHAKRRQLMGPHRGPSNITVADMRAIREVFGDACVYCGDPAKSLDHVIPLARGGEHAVGNLVPACLPCNKSKSDKLLTEWAGPPHKEL